MAQTAHITRPIGSRRERAEHLVTARLEQAFRAEELAGLKLAMRAQLIALIVIAGWLFVWVDGPRLYFIEIILSLFAVCAILNYRLCLSDPVPPWWRRYAIVGAYFILLTYSMVGYDLLIGAESPPQMMLRNGTIVYFFMFIALVSITHLVG